jgi:hypothetical protein
MAQYTYSGPIDGQQLPRLPFGTSVLIKGPEDAASEVLFEILSMHPEEATVLVNTRRPLEAVASRHPVVADEPNLEIVDIGDSSGEPVESARHRTQTLAEDADLTAIGIAMVQAFNALGGASNVRVGLDSLSALLTRFDRETVLNFLQIVCGRLRVSGYLGLFVFDPSGHAPHVVATVESQFNTVVDVARYEEDGVVELVGSIEM